MVLLKRLSQICILALSLAFIGCEDDDADGNVQLRMTERVENQGLVFDQLQYEAQAGHTFSVITLKYYISRVTLISQTGAAIELEDVIYRDARDPFTEVVDLGKIPNGTYTSLDFIFGLDEVMNVDGGLENTLENINMEWPIPGDEGYHYMKFEGKYDVYNTSTIHSFNLHTGATGGNQNYFQVSLPLDPLVIDGNNWQLSLTMDLQEWLQNPEVYDFEFYGPAIMMNQDAQEHLQANGETVFSISTSKN